VETSNQTGGKNLAFEAIWTQKGERLSDFLLGRFGFEGSILEIRIGKRALSSEKEKKT